MSRFQKGDVLLVHYVFPDKATGRLVDKPRPVVVLEESSHDERLVIQCTSKNRSDKLKGIWVPEDSDAYRKMGLLQPTFINVSETKEIKFNQIIRKIGNCPFMDKIDELLEG